MEIVMPSGLIMISTQEVERVTVIKQIIEKRLKQNAGAKLLKLTPRQIRRLIKAYRRDGAKGEWGQEHS
jgi:predicted DNA binding protein